jgi:hypothetical protein
MSRPSLLDGRRPSEALGVLALLFLVGCGGESPAGDTELVEASLVRESDLPGELPWKVAEDETDPQFERFDKDLDVCERRFDPTVQSTKAEQESDAFESGDLSTVSSTGWVVDDPEKRDAFFESLDDQFTCMSRALTRFLRREFATGISIEVAEPYELDVDTDADRSAGRAIQIGVAVPGGETLTIFLDVVAVEEGRLLAGYSFFHSGEITLEEEMDTVGTALARVIDLEDG